MQIERQRYHALLFNAPEQVVHAAKVLRQAGFTIEDAYTPFAVHGLDAAMGLKPTRLPFATFVGAMLGLVIGLALQFFVHVQSWPLNIGGKTFSAIPAMVPVAFEVTILFAAFATVLTLLGRSRLFPWRCQKASMLHAGITDNRFVLLICEESAAFSLTLLTKLSRELHAELRESRVTP